MVGLYILLTLLTQKLSLLQLRMVKYIRENYKDAEIIGGGGIQTLNDIRDYKKAGANHFSISTLCFNPIRFLSFYYDFISLKN